MLVVCATVFYSCDSDGEGPGDEGTTSETAIIGKWEISNGGNTRAEGTTEYGSFEFTADNKYIITQPTTTTSGEKALLVIFGDYVTGSSKDNELTLDLKEFGVITIAVNKTSATITVNGVTYVAVKAKEVDASDNTKKLCYTWKLDKSYQLWHQDDGKKEEETLPGEGETITFTNNGTYMISYQLTAEEIKYGETPYEYGTWKWVDSDIIEITYEIISDEDYVGPIEPEPINPVTKSNNSEEPTIGKSRYTITELTSNKLTMEEICSFDPEQDPDDKYIMWLSK